MCWACGTHLPGSRLHLLLTVPPSPTHTCSAQQDEEKEVQHLASLTYLTLSQAREAYRLERQDLDRVRESKSRLLRERGFCVEVPEGDAY